MLLREGVSTRKLEVYVYSVSSRIREYAVYQEVKFMDEFETLLTSSRIAVDRWLKAHMGNCADAEDVLQETCLAAFQVCQRAGKKKG